MQFFVQSLFLRSWTGDSTGTEVLAVSVGAAHGRPWGLTERLTLCPWRSVAAASPAPQRPCRTSLARRDVADEDYLCRAMAGSPGSSGVTWGPVGPSLHRGAAGTEPLGPVLLASGPLVLCPERLVIRNTFSSLLPNDYAFISLKFSYENFSDTQLEEFLVNTLIPTRSLSLCSPGPSSPPASLNHTDLRRKRREWWDRGWQSFTRLHLQLFSFLL